jgi:hypothetical protein
MRSARRNALRPIPAAEVISGERIQRLADATIASAEALAYNPRLSTDSDLRFIGVRDWREVDTVLVDRVSRCRTQFVYGHELGSFLSAIGGHLPPHGYRLVVHNSDAEVGLGVSAWLDAHPGVFEHVFAQNVTVDDGRITPLPIGMANSMWPHGDIGMLVRARERAPDWSARHPVVLAAFLLHTHPSRCDVLETLRTVMAPGGVRRPRRPLSFRRYLRALGESRFCACPRGNGPDTHSLWEALYMGAIPLVDASCASRYWSAQGVPVVQVEHWSSPDIEDFLPTSPGSSAGWEEALRLSTYRRLVQAP